MILALAGGVGGAKLALGLSHLLPPERLAIVVNTGDDFEYCGLHVSPDIDTVIYTLAGLANQEQGWGRASETWSFMDSLEQLSKSTWFRIGDKDLAVHVERTHRLRSGQSLSAVTESLAAALAARHAVIPMSDMRVRTTLHTTVGELDFQDYFVRLKCSPEVRKIVISGAPFSLPSPPLKQFMDGGIVEGVVVCPSNPLLSVAPILSVPAIGAWLMRRTFPAVAVSPIIGNQAVKGPLAKLMWELGMHVSVLGIARCYQGLIDALVIDEIDTCHAPAIEALGIRVHMCPILMTTLADRERVARIALSLLKR